MKFKFLIAGFGLSLLLTIPLNGQNVLSKEAAVQMAVDQNYQIRISSNDVRVSQNLTDRRSLGYHPAINFTAGPTADFGGSSQTFNNGNEASTSNALSWGVGATLSADYAIFDKVRTVLNEQSRESLDLSILLLRQNVELTMLDVLRQYYVVARAYTDVQLQEETISLSQRRLQRAELQFSYGQVSGLDVLNARVDIQRDSIGLLSIRQQLENARRDLQVIMGQESGQSFAVDTTVLFQEGLSLQEILNSAANNHVDLAVIDKQTELARTDLLLIDAARKPTLSGSASYRYNFSDNPAGSFITSSNARGVAAGVTVGWNIFDGGLRSVQEQNAMIALENQQLSRDWRWAQIRRDIENAWTGYQTALFILRAERETLNTNRENYNRTEELFNAGQINSVEFRQAQLNLLQALTSYYGARYDAKIIELELLQLSGNLIGAGADQY